jgi:hypothetical protein
MTGKKWIKFKKTLPANWCQLVVDSISKKGIEPLTANQVSKIRAGILTNPEWQLLVWEEINSLKKEASHFKSKIVTLQNGS